MKQDIYILVNKSDLSDVRRESPSEIALYLCGRRLANYIVIKNWERIVPLPFDHLPAHRTQIEAVEKALKEA